VLILIESGKLYTFGFGYRGRLGYPTHLSEDHIELESPITPTLVRDLEDRIVHSIGCGGAHSLVIYNDK
jgi:alpha-tubulin suppressor-like RCC1 family protein